MKLWLSAFLAIGCAAALAQAPGAAPTQRLRGTVQSFEAGTLVVTRSSRPRGAPSNSATRTGRRRSLVPDGIPILTFKPGDRGLLVPGARVLITSQMRDGKLTALRAFVGRDGFAPPM